MIRVAVETATRIGSVAVGRGGDVLAEVELGAQRKHAAAALPALDEALRTAGVDRADVDEVVVGAGPGSFTGVRVAAATAKGLAAGLGIPLRAYSSLLALAVEAARTHGVSDAGPVLALFDARRGEVYGGCWRIEVGVVETLVAPRVGEVADVLDALEAPGLTGGDVVAVGDGADAYAEALATAADALGLALRTGPGGVHPTARALLWLAHHHPALGAVPDAAEWEPDYVRGSSAERGVAG